MADVTKTFTTDYPNTAKRDVDDMMSLIAFKKHPVYASLRKGSQAIQLLVEKPEDELKAAEDSAALEGADAVVEARDAPTLIQNRVQRINKVYGVSGDMQKAANYGRKNELSRQRGLCSMEISRNTEWAMTNGTLQEGTSIAASKMNGLVNFAPAANSYTFNDTPDAGNHVTEDILLDVMQAMYAEGADPDTVIAPLAQKRKISDFSDKGRITVNVDASKKELTMAVNVLETDFGTVFVIPSIFVEPTDVTGTLYDTILIYDKTKVARKMFRSLTDTKLAHTGDSDKYEMQHSLTILPDSSKVVGKITNCSRVKVS